MICCCVDYRSSLMLIWVVQVTSESCMVADKNRHFCVLLRLARLTHSSASFKAGVRLSNASHGPMAYQITAPCLYGDQKKVYALLRLLTMMVITHTQSCTAPAWSQYGYQLSREWV